MPSTLAWLDHDVAARERTKRILALFQEKGTQDQLGLGGIRDSFSDLLFPGTSTIQTRLRYFLFIPWIYQSLEEKEVPSRAIETRARSMELALVKPLLSTKERGVFGSTAGGNLKRLPSEVYWGGLLSWGIRRFDASQNQYHQAVDDLYRRRKAARLTSKEGNEPSEGIITWHTDVPRPPESFPEKVTLKLRREEAEFLRDRIVTEHKDTLLAWLTLRSTRTSVDFPWEHPLLDSMPAKLQETLQHARVFSEVMNGAPILYNLMVSEEAKRDELVSEYEDWFREWADSLDLKEIREWSLNTLFAIARAQGGHTISAQTETFVSRWVQMTRADPYGLTTQSQARQLIRHREILLKGPHSLFQNQKAREEKYSGDLGVGRLNYRWPDVQVLLNDLHAGLQGK